MAHIQTITVSSKGQIVIPEEVRRELAIKDGTRLVLVERGGKIVLEKEKQLIMKMEKLGWLLLAESSLAKDWLAKEEDEAWKDL
jgi:AbrB family looped-hinge helix DNA binding protein